MKTLKSCIVLYIILTVITGVIYPLVATGISQLFFKDKANGSLVTEGNEIKGSVLIGQKFTDPAYFWSRPSASDYSALPSGASNQGPTSESLRQTIEKRKDDFAPFIPAPIPADLLLASGSGLDPDISPSAALSQIDHVANSRQLSDVQKATLIELVNKEIEKPQWGIFGAPRVNVLKLNLMIDKMFGTPVLNGVAH